MAAVPTHPMKIIRALTASALLVASLTSCVAPAKTSGEKDAKGKKIEYVYITPTGSSIPIRVPKDEVNAQSDNDAQDKAYTDMQRNGSAHLPQGPGGK